MRAFSVYLHFVNKQSKSSQGQYDLTIINCWKVSESNSVTPYIIPLCEHNFACIFQLKIAVFQPFQLLMPTRCILTYIMEEGLCHRLSTASESWRE